MSGSRTDDRVGPHRADPVALLEGEWPTLLELLEAESRRASRCTRSSANLQVHKTPEVCAWLETRPRWHFRFAPTHASWLNQIEPWFSILSRRLLRSGAFKNMPDLRAQLLAFIERYDPTAKPFAWAYQGKPLTK